jgi:hypothetical protein
MSKLAHALERTLANANSPDLQAQQRRSLQQRKNPIKRVATVAIHDFAATCPNIASRMVGRGLANSGYSHVGAGAVSVVYRRDREVIKVNQRTIRMDEAQRQAVANQNRKEHELMKGFLAVFLTSQETDVDQHPIWPKLRAVRILQPFCDITDLGLFPSYGPHIHMDRLVSATETYPGIEYALREFCEKAQLMHENTGYVPDTSGTSNVVMINGTVPTLTLIDGQPIGPVQRDVHENILGQLGSLQTGLDQVA